MKWLERCWDLSIRQSQQYVSFQSFQCLCCMWYFHYRLRPPHHPQWSQRVAFCPKEYPQGIPHFNGAPIQPSQEQRFISIAECSPLANLGFSFLSVDHQQIGCDFDVPQIRRWSWCFMRIANFGATQHQSRFVFHNYFAFGPGPRRDTPRRRHLRVVCLCQSPPLHWRFISVSNRCCWFWPR